jgi:hypothetical protein
MQRRELLTLAGLSLAALAGPKLALAQGVLPGGGELTSFLYVWADDKGVSHCDIRSISAKAGPMTFAGGMDLHFDNRSVIAMHRPPHRQLVVTLQGGFEIESADGTRLKPPASGLTFMEDMTGQGHIARLTNAVNINIAVPDDFDMLRWARGEA